MYSIELLPLPDGPVIAAASPGASENVTFDSTVSVPCGAGYCLLTPATLSTTCSGRLRLESAVDVEQAVGRLCDVVVRANTIVCRGTETFGERWIRPRRIEPVRQRVGIIALAEQTAARLLDYLGERAAPRLDDRHPRRHRFEQEHAFRLVVRCRHRQHVEATHELQLRGAIDRAAIRELAAESRAFERASRLFE